MASAKMSVTSTLQTMLLNKSLSSMVKGIRNHKSENGGSKAQEQEYINKCMAEIKEELKTSFPDVKAVAIQKLIYLQMIGYDISWAAFHIIELMSAAWFGHKRIGYLAASLSFTKDTDVILLTTHLFRKGFNSSQGGGPTSAAVAVEGFQYETGAAISCLANIVTPDLAQDLLADVYGLMNSSRPYIRKKAVLVLLKIFKAWPKALRLSFDRLKEKLDDENQGVVSAAVYVICELASKNPKNYLSLAPQFFKILTTSSNNWVLIKVVKLLGALVPLEPRLAKKLTEPLTDIISTTPAKSLLYEGVNTLLCGELRSKTVVRLCLEKLRNFIEDQDQNLKYLGLLGLHKLLQKQPRVVSEHKDLILDCLNDEDITIRMRALDLITSMVSLKNLTGIIAKLMQHLEASEGVGHYREHVLERILFICSQDSFAYISDFEWYVSVLVELTHLNGVSRENAMKINDQLLEVVVRVPGVRSYTIKQMIHILLANRLTSLPPTMPSTVNGTSASTNSAAAGGAPSSKQSNSTQGHMVEVLHAVGFIIGEYTEYLSEQDDDFYFDLLTNMTRSEILTNLPGKVQNVMVQNVMKVFSSALLQPFDNADVKDQLSQVKLAQPKRTISEDESSVANIIGADTGDDLMPEPTPEPKPKIDAADDILADEEADDFDSNGLRRRKHPSLKRTFQQWHDWIARLLTVLYQQLPLFTRAESVEVQERAVAYLQFIKWLIVFGEWDSKIPNFKSATTLTSPTKSDATKPTTPSLAPTSTSSSTPVQQVTQKLDLLSMDSFTVANQQALSIFDTPATSSSSSTNTTASADPFTALMANNSTPAASTSNTASSPLAINTSNVSLSSGVKDKLRSISIQFGLLYSERLNPVHPKAQKKVALPKGLDLDSWINPGCEDAKIDEDEDDDGEDDDPYSLKKSKSKSKPRGGLYDDNDDDYSSMGGFGAKSTIRSSTAGKKKDDYSSSSLFDDDLTASKRNLTPEEKEEARRRQEKRKQQQASDPYYLKDSSSSSSSTSAASTVGGINVDNIPVKRLEDDDLPGLKVVDKSKRLSEEPRKSNKVFKVLKHDDMPDADESDADDDGKKKKKKDRKKDRKSSANSDSDNDLDMDLTTPLKPDEVMPRVKTYADQQAEKEAQKKAEEAKGSRKKKHKKDEKDRDRDRDRDRKSKKDKKESPSKSSSNAPAQASFLDLFDMGVTSPPGATKEKEPEKKSSSSSSSSSSAPSSSSSSSDRQHTLFKDSSVKVKYTPTFTSGSNVQVAFEVYLSKDNSKKIASLPKLTLEVKSGKYVKNFAGSNVKSTDKGCVVTIRDVHAGSSVTDKMVVELNTTLDRSFLLTGRLSYTTDRDGKGKDGESIDIDIPMSTFILPKKVTTTEMANLLAMSNKPPTSLAQSNIALKKLRVSEVIRTIPGLLNVSLVEAVNFTATYFGTLATNQTSVAVLVKARKGDDSSVSIEIKTTSSKVSDELLEECTKKLK